MCSNAKHFLLPRHGLRNKAFIHSPKGLSTPRCSQLYLAASAESEGQLKARASVAPARCVCYANVEKLPLCTKCPGRVNTPAYPPLGTMCQKDSPRSSTRPISGGNGPTVRWSSVASWAPPHSMPVVRPLSPHIADAASSTETGSSAPRPNSQDTSTAFDVEQHSDTAHYPAW